MSFYMPGVSFSYLLDKRLVFYWNNSPQVGMTSRYIDSVLHSLYSYSLMLRA